MPGKRAKFEAAVGALVSEMSLLDKLPEADAEGLLRGILATRDIRELFEAVPAEITSVALTAQLQDIIGRLARDGELGVAISPDEMEPEPMEPGRREPSLKVDAEQEPADDDGRVETGTYDPGLPEDDAPPEPPAEAPDEPRVHAIPKGVAKAKKLAKQLGVDIRHVKGKGSLQAIIRLIEKAGVVLE